MTKWIICREDAEMIVVSDNMDTQSAIHTVSACVLIDRLISLSKSCQMKLMHALPVPYRGCIKLLVRHACHYRQASNTQCVAM